MRIFNFLPLVIGFIIILIFAYLINLSNNAKDYVYKFADSKLQLVSGAVLNLKDLRGEFYVVHFSSPNCEACLEDFPLLEQIREKCKTKIIGVLVANSKPKENSFYDYLAVDQNNSIARLLKDKKTPQTLIINPKGMVIFHYTGPLDKREIEEKVMPVI
jgi:hypothetical protein